MLDTFARDAAAKAAGVTVLPAMAFYGGLADLLASAALGGATDADAVDIAVALDGWHPTRGTRITGERNHYPRTCIEHGRSRTVPDPAPLRETLGVWCGSMIGKIRDMLTVEGLAYACYDYPEMVEDMVETSCVLVEDFLDAVLPHLQFDYGAGWEDICYKSGPLVSVEFFRDIVVPRYQRISRKLRAHGIETWWIDCDGDVRPLIPHFLAGGVNTMFPWEVNGSGHPGASLDRWPELRIMGGVDKMVLGRGRAEIRALLESLAPYVERGGFIPFCDHRCPPNVNPDDYLYYLDLKEKMFGLPASPTR